MNAPTARLHYQVVMDKLDKIYAVASTRQAYEESRDEDDRDLNTIHILELICDLASDRSSSAELEEYLDRAVLSEEMK